MAGADIHAVQTAAPGAQQEAAIAGAENGSDVVAADTAGPRGVVHVVINETGSPIDPVQPAAGRSHPEHPALFQNGIHGRMTERGRVTRLVGIGSEAVLVQVVFIHPAFLRADPDVTQRVR